MTDAQKLMMEKLGLTEQDFQPSDKTDKERIGELESQNKMLIECIMEMSELLYA